MSKYDGRVTVADLLRREGIAQELPVAAGDVHDAPTDLIPVAELLRRENGEDRPPVDFYEDRYEDGLEQDSSEEDSSGDDDPAEGPFETRFAGPAEGRLETGFAGPAEGRLETGFAGPAESRFETRILDGRPEPAGAGKTDRRWIGKAGAVAAGIAALAGLAVTVLSTGQLQETAAPIPGGNGGPAIDPPTTSASDSANADSKLLTSTLPTPSAVEAQAGSAPASSSHSGSWGGVAKHDVQPPAPPAPPVPLAPPAPLPPPAPPAVTTDPPPPASSSSQSATTTTTSDSPSSSAGKTTPNPPPNATSTTSSGNPGAPAPGALGNGAGTITGTLGDLVGGLLSG